MRGFQQQSTSCLGLGDGLLRPRHVTCLLAHAAGRLHGGADFSCRGRRQALAAEHRAEDRAFGQLEEIVVAQGRELAQPLLRYNPKSRSWPYTLGRDWNRSFEFVPDDAWGGIVLVHGLTDSPYSMRAVGELMRDQGLHVVAPRMPGHGLAPSGLLDATWQDWLAVVRLAVEHLRTTLGEDAPILLGGYSNGGALAVKYTL